ncbi:hypothetical protein XG19_004663 [Salmonella enterica subsp. enterica serovar Gaminara]|nr:hypothetical protein [Salmonella enterica subsp. enterica serovar Gaminara]ECO0313591.1 hypothetical protein [Salmonella enterica subsp. enterica serovar Schwarzengrund]EDP8790003.1 hypothetical protein [Salmonella enterica subsp. enterica]ECY4705430.1 hypothetical protein [Salmonella enterica subsp. enterica serovar Gaminara]ECY5825957.1 hypothetical protein [Salmonella enterica subsp. enterica serovar Schwarzengrund]
MKMKRRAGLSLLKPLDMRLYQQQEKALNEDLTSASRYLLMRICQQIHNVLFNQLLNKSTVAVSPGGR